MFFSIYLAFVLFSFYYPWHTICPRILRLIHPRREGFHAKLELVWPSSVLPFYKMYEFDDVKQVVHSRFNLKIGIKAIWKSKIRLLSLICDKLYRICQAEFLMCQNAKTRTIQVCKCCCKYTTFNFYNSILVKLWTRLCCSNFTIIDPWSTDFWSWIIIEFIINEKMQYLIQPILYSFHHLFYNIHLYIKYSLSIYNMSRA